MSSTLGFTAPGVRASYNNLFTTLFVRNMASLSLGNVKGRNTQNCDVLFQNQNKLRFYIIDR